MIKSIIPNKSFDSIFTTDIITQYLKLDDASDLAVIENIRDYAISYAQITTKNLVSFDNYDIEIANINSNTIHFALYPISSINHIIINEQTIINNIDYTVLNNNSTILFNNIINKCIINISGGYTSISKLAPELRIAILMHISFLYDNRSGSSVNIPTSVANIYNKISKIRLSFN